MNRYPPQLKREYIDTGKAKLVYRDLPLSFHPSAQVAAEAAECAGEQGKYYPYHDILFENTARLDVSDLKRYASQIGLNTGSFNACLDSGQMAQEVRDDASAANALDATGTPTFFVNGVKIRGAQPFEVFQAAIEAELAQ